MTNTIPQVYDNLDWSWRDEDPGDFEYCTDCDEWVLFEEFMDVTDEHKILTTKVCPKCGATKEEV